MHELLLGGQRSGKSRRAEDRAAQWLAGTAADGVPREAVLLATAQAGDAEMAARIARHQADRAVRVPGLVTVEEPRELAAALRRLADPRRLIVVDCLTLWLTNWLMPLPPLQPDAQAWARQQQALLEALAAAPAPVVLVSNEIGLGVMPMGAETRAWVDALGRLHQRLAAACGRVTLMVAGCPLVVKAPA
ncbi:bifunctional adenosylcobinamide kinase/adenosylcobinamide-phosphate guanylyltransferase [Pseudaquabacterium rugosum]|uniref:Bifunctional adenosylcobalamin biosynthesis protein n=1 Tax=Pseudaquabacterium rugosum TaxID=2984194 RepID=A0ABU9BD72_9BURK